MTFAQAMRLIDLCDALDDKHAELAALVRQCLADHDELLLACAALHDAACNMQAPSSNSDDRAVARARFEQAAADARTAVQETLK